MLSRVEDMPATRSLAVSMSVSRKAASRESMDVPLEVEEIVDHPELVESIDVMLSVSQKGEDMIDGEIVDSIDVMLWVSENGEAIVNGGLVETVEYCQRDAGPQEVTVAWFVVRYRARAPWTGSYILRI